MRRGIYKLTNYVESGIIDSGRRYIYEKCPDCGKKLFRITATSEYKNIFVWCKTCKKEILVNKKSQ